MINSGFWWASLVLCPNRITLHQFEGKIPRFGCRVKFFWIGILTCLFGPFCTIYYIVSWWVKHQTYVQGLLTSLFSCFKISWLMPPSCDIFWGVRVLRYGFTWVPCCGACACAIISASVPNTAAPPIDWNSLTADLFTTFTFGSDVLPNWCSTYDSLASACYNQEQIGKISWSIWNIKIM